MPATLPSSARPHVHTQRASLAATDVQHKAAELQVIAHATYKPILRGYVPNYPFRWNHYPTEKQQKNFVHSRSENPTIAKFSFQLSPLYKLPS